MDKKNEIKVPFRFFIVIILIILFMISLSISGWTMSLFFLTYFILFFIFFEINPTQEKYTVENKKIIGKNKKIRNCEIYKHIALDNINIYNDCKQKKKPKIICPLNLETTDDIVDESIKKRYVIPNREYLKSREPSNVNRVCGLIPGYKYNKKKNNKKISNLLSDQELQNLIKKHIILYDEKIKLDNQILNNPLDYELNKKLININNSINILNPIIISNLTHQNKDYKFIKNAIN